MKRRTQVKLAKRLTPGDLLVIRDEVASHIHTVNKVGPSQGRIPADGNRKLAITVDETFESAQILRLRANDPVRVLSS